MFFFFKPAEKAEFEAQGFGFLSYKNVLHFCTQDCFKNFYWKKIGIVSCQWRYVDITNSYFFLVTRGKNNRLSKP